MTKLIESLNKAIGASFFRHKGCLVERKEGRYLALGEHHPTPQAARAYIDHALQRLKSKF